MSEPTAQPVIAEGASSSEVFKSFVHLPDLADITVPQHRDAPSEPTPPAPEPKAPETKETKQDDDIPEQFIGGKKEEAAPEVDEYEKLQSEEIKGQVRQDQWKTLKQATKKKVDSLTAELLAAKTELEAAKARGVPDDIAAKLKTYEESLAEKDQLLERIAVEQSPKFKERFGTKETQISERIKRVGTEMGLDTEKLQQALLSSPKRRVELLEEIGAEGAVLSSIAGLMNQYDLLQDEKGQFLAQSKETHAQWQREQQETMTRQEQQRAQEEDRVFNSVLDEMSKTYAPYQQVEGNKAWNEQGQALREEARKYFNGQVPLEDLARAVIKGVGAPVNEKIMARMNKEISELRAENAELKRAQPGSLGSFPQADGKIDESKMTIEERQRATFNRFVSGAANAGFGNGSR